MHANGPASEYAITPIDALERIGYLLDRGLADGYRVRAFQRALDVLRAMPTDELAERSRSGRLTELAGIGDAIAQVVRDALAGQVPGYLQRLERETTTAALTSKGAAIREALLGDCHMHSTWSDGGASIDDMAHTAAALGHEYVVATDHSGRLTVAHGLSRARLEAQMAEVDAANVRLHADGVSVRVLKGIEVDINEDGTLDADEDLLDELDLVVASVHAKLRQDRQAMTERMVLAAANPLVDVLGHCTGRKVTGKGRAGVDADFDLVFAACARFDTAVEINCRPERLDPPRALLARALEIGCRFVISTDAHAPGQLEWQPLGCDRAAEMGLPLDRIVNTWATKDLLAWTGSHQP